VKEGITRAMKILMAMAVLAFASGCAVNRATATVEPNTSLDRIKTVHVAKLAEDSRGINTIIADALRARGMQATTDPAKPGKVDAIVTYADRWMWDITMYMLELTVTLREPGTEFPLATGNSYHTSLTRKSPKEMVDEVLDNIYKKGKS
jgi:hypothetical protein